MVPPAAGPRAPVGGSGARGDVREDLVSVFAQVLAGEVVGRGDVPVGVDQVADASREVGVVLFVGALGTVGLADGAVLVADQRVGEALGLCEGLLVGDAVEGRADYDGVGRLVLWGSVTEPPTLNRSTAC
jgi:hypothetical protein